MVEKQIESKFPGTCTQCGQRFPAGTKIMWERGNGARHVKCPIPKAVEPAKPEVAKPLFAPLPQVPPEEVISIFWSDGEYLSDYMPRSRSKELEEAGIARYVSGWGTKMDNAFLMFAAGMPIGPISREFYEKIGQDQCKFTFTWAQVVAYVTPLREAAEKKHAAKIAAKNQKEADAFAQAKATGQRVVLSVRSEECDGSVQECDIDNIYTYAMPDGTKKTVRSHSY